MGVAVVKVTREHAVRAGEVLQPHEGRGPRYQRPQLRYAHLPREGKDRAGTLWWHGRSSTETDGDETREGSWG